EPDLFFLRFRSVAQGALRFMDSETDSDEIIAGFNPRMGGTLGLAAIVFGIILLVPAIVLSETLFLGVDRENISALATAFTVHALLAILCISSGLFMFLGRKHFYVKLTKSDLIISDFYRKLTVPLSGITSADKYTESIIVKTVDQKTIYLLHYSSQK